MIYEKEIQYIYGPDSLMACSTRQLVTSGFPRGRVCHKNVRQRDVISSMAGLVPMNLMMGSSNS